MNPEYKFEKLFKFPKCSQEVCDSFVLFVIFFLSNPDDAGESFYNKFIYMHKEDNWDLRGFFAKSLGNAYISLVFLRLLFSPRLCTS